MPIDLVWSREILSKFRLTSTFPWILFSVEPFTSPVHMTTILWLSVCSHGETSLVSTSHTCSLSQKHVFPLKWLNPQTEDWFSPFTCCQYWPFHWQCLWVWASLTTQTWMSHFWLCQKSWQSTDDVPHPARDWAGGNEIEASLGKNTRLPPFLPKAQQFFKLKCFIDCCMPLVNFQRMEMVALWSSSRFIVALGEDDLLTSSLRHN